MSTASEMRAVEAFVNTVPGAKAAMAWLATANLTEDDLATVLPALERFINSLQSALARLHRG
jgi:hypothetical protein